MKNYITPIQMIAKVIFCFGTFPKTYVSGTGKLAANGQGFVFVGDLND